MLNSKQADQVQIDFRNGYVAGCTCKVAQMALNRIADRGADAMAAMGSQASGTGVVWGSAAVVVCAGIRALGNARHGCIELRKETDRRVYENMSKK